MVISPDPLHGLRRSALGAMVVSAVLLAPGLGARGHWTAAEGRPPLVARDIVSTGRVCPAYLAGEPYLNKPPLYHGLVAAGFWAAGGESEWLARVPALLAAAAAVGLTALLAGRRGGTRAAWMSGGLLLLTHRFFTLGRSAELETLLTASVVGLFCGLDDPRARRGFWVCAGSAVVGTLTKGPTLILIFPALYLVGRVLTRPRPPFPGLPIAGWGVGVLVATLAYWGPQWSDPDLRAQLLHRVAMGNVEHARGAFYYLEKLPLGLLPAILLLPWAWRGIRSGRAQAPMDWLWTVGLTVATFSCFSSKQSHYLLPIYPVIAAVGGVVLAMSLPEKQRSRMARIGMVAAVGLLAVDWVCAVRFDAERSVRVPMEEFRRLVGGAPLASLDQKPTVLYYLNRPVELPGTIDAGYQWLKEHPDGFLLVESDRGRPVGPVLAATPVASRWKSESGRRGFVLLGPGPGR